jgi:hypothetical protein
VGRMIRDIEPQLTASEWRDLAAALRQADNVAAGVWHRGNEAPQPARSPLDFSPAAERVEAVRRFVTAVRFRREITSGLKENLQERGFNGRQIAALELLAA